MADTMYRREIFIKGLVTIRSRSSWKGSSQANRHGARKVAESVFMICKPKAQIYNISE